MSIKVKLLSILFFLITGWNNATAGFYQDKFGTQELNEVYSVLISDPDEVNKFNGIMDNVSNEDYIITENLVKLILNYGQPNILYHIAANIKGSIMSATGKKYENSITVKNQLDELSLRCFIISIKYFDNDALKTLKSLIQASVKDDKVEVVYQSLEALATESKQNQSSNFTLLKYMRKLWYV